MRGAGSIFGCFCRYLPRPGCRRFSCRAAAAGISASPSAARVTSGFRPQARSRVLARPVPRVFWPGKPIDPGFDLPAIVGMKGVSLSTSIIGEWYITFGWIAVVIGAWLHGRLARTVNQLREVEIYHTNPIVYGLAVMVP